MTIRLQQFGVNDSPYERPNQTWVCGWAAEGRPCAVGPDRRGRCTAAAQSHCEPRRGDPDRGESPDRWYCTRPQPFGGPCEPGPLPDGHCCRPEPEHQLCQPRLSLRARRNRLTLACTALAVGLLALLLAGPWGLRYISPGPLAAPHQTMERLHGGAQSCALCHEQDPQSGPLVRPVSDLACLNCHVAEAHYPARSIRSGTAFAKPGWPGKIQAAENCFQCHDEHRGREHDLVRLSDNQCIHCHGNLAKWVRADGSLQHDQAHPGPNQPRTADRLPVANEIHSFAGDHPDWRILRSQRIDPTPIRFEHHVHMDPDTGKMQERLTKWADDLSDEQRTLAVRRSATGELSLACSACHQPDATGRYMQPIRFDQHCVQCHDLGSKAEMSVPHGRQVRDFIPVAAAALVSSPPEQPPARSGGPRRRGPGGPPSATPSSIEFQDPKALATHFKQQIQEQIEKLNRSLRNTCGKCHDPSSDPARMPDPHIPDRWLTESRFDHAAHRFTSCAQCHPQAAAGDGQATAATETSADSALKWTGRTKQIMIPPIASCRTCHASGTAARAHAGSVAPSNCTTCHLYHAPGHGLTLHRPASLPPTRAPAD